MDDLLRGFPELRGITAREAMVAAVDILLVAYLIYRLLILVRGTRAWRIVMGILMLWMVGSLSDRLGLKTLHWVLGQASPMIPVALVILLLPELRQAIEGLGRLDRWTQRVVAPNEPRAEVRTVEEVVAAAAELAADSTGAIIVMEKSAALNEIAGNGVILDARVSAPLLVSIFYEKNPLHDGAVVIRGDHILAAACRLPLSESSRLDQNVHMRHRAAVGISESSDCVAIVVSEERGTISVAIEGRLHRLGSHLDLRAVLNKELRSDDSSAAHPRKPRERRHQLEPKAK